MGEELVQKFRVKMAAAGELRIAVETQASASEMCGERVNDHVARAGVEGGDIAWTSARGDYGDVGDAADVEGDAAEMRVAIKNVIHKWDERGALAACGYIGGTKIGDGGDAGACGDDGGLGDLHGGGSSRAEKGRGRALMIDRLAMRTDERNAARPDAEFFAGAKDGVSEKFAETEIELADFARGGGCAVGEAENGFANGGRVGECGEIQKLRVRKWLRGAALSLGDVHERDIDAVGGRAGHESENECAARSASHESCFLSAARRLSASRGLRLSRSAARRAS